MQNVPVLFIFAFQEAHIASGVSAVYIGQIERDTRINPQIKILEKLGKAFVI